MIITASGDVRPQPCPVEIGCTVRAHERIAEPRLEVVHQGAGFRDVLAVDMFYIACLPETVDAMIAGWVRDRH